MLLLHTPSPTLCNPSLFISSFPLSPDDEWTSESDDELRARVKHLNRKAQSLSRPTTSQHPPASSVESLHNRSLQSPKSNITKPHSRVSQASLRKGYRLGTGEQQALVGTKPSHYKPHRAIYVPGLAQLATNQVMTDEDTTAFLPSQDETSVQPLTGSMHLSVLTSLQHSQRHPQSDNQEDDDLRRKKRVDSYYSRMNTVTNQFDMLQGTTGELIIPNQNRGDGASIEELYPKMKKSEE